MKMHILSGGRLKMRKSVFVPEADRQELFEIPVSCYLLKHPQGNVLFDTGCHPSTAINAEERWGGMVKFMTPISKPQDNVIDQLKLLNMQPDDIDVVVNSHLHSDHCGCNAFFKKASFICHANELAAAQQDDSENMGFLAVDWQQPMPTETIKAQKDLFNDGRIVLVPVPGHTPGMTGALIALDRSGAFFLASDSVALESNLLKDQIPRNMWSAELASQSMAEIRKIAAGGAKVLFGHDDAQYQTLRTGLEYYD